MSSSSSPQSSSLSTMTAPTSPVDTAPKRAESPIDAARWSSLEDLTSKAGLLATLLAKSVEKQRENAMKSEVRKASRAANKEKKQASAAANPKATRATRTKEGRSMGKGKQPQGKKEPVGRSRLSREVKQQDESSDSEGEEDEVSESEEGEDEVEHQDDPGQPALLTGATLKPFQRSGVRWLTALFENGLNGILADEMGLGKTIQTIGLLAHLKEMKVNGAYLVICPLSTLANWGNEFQRFAPSLNVITYYGSAPERAELRKKHLEPFISSSTARKAKGGKQSAFTVFITTYDIVLRDAKELVKVPYKYCIVDEAQRLKNHTTKLVSELKLFSFSNRLLLTGTPLQNNLTELWSLLAFIMPIVFQDRSEFLEIFSDLGGVEASSQDRSALLVGKLHEILQPFLLRRLKKDVIKGLPHKKEYLLTAPLTSTQKELYDACLNKTLRGHLLDSFQSDSVAGSGASTPTSEFSVGSKRSSVNAGGRGQRKKVRKSYFEANDDDDERMDDDEFETSLAVEDEQRREQEQIASSSADLAELGRVHQLGRATKKVNALKLQNVIMQLRKVCNHPYLFDWDVDPDTGIERTGDELVSSSGKMLLLDQLLDELFKRGHKVLLFSQFTTMLNIVHAWANEHKGWPVCRIDGGTSIESRKEQMVAFNEGTKPEDPRLFLLSTRAGGVGINLVGADTVIFFDSDFNPQMDLQAMDRAHRIGQTKPVLVFRLVAGNTVENRILERASEKRKLEHMVIGKGDFKFDKQNVREIMTGSRSRNESMAQVAQQLLAEEDGDNVVLAEKGDQILSQQQLDLLLDRSDEVMTSKKAYKASPKKGEKLAFSVRETKVNSDNPEQDDFLATLLALPESKAASREGTESL